MPADRSNVKTWYWLRAAFAAVLGIVVCADATHLVRASDTTVDISFVLFGDIDEMEAVDGRGGFARLAAAVRAERARAKHVVVVHAGDKVSPADPTGVSPRSPVSVLRPERMACRAGGLPARWWAGAGWS